MQECWKKSQSLVQLKTEYWQKTRSRSYLFSLDNQYLNQSYLNKKSFKASFLIFRNVVGGKTIGGDSMLDPVSLGVGFHDNQDIAIESCFISLVHQLEVIRLHLGAEGETGRSFETI